MAPQVCLQVLEVLELKVGESGHSLGLQVTQDNKPATTFALILQV